MLKQCKESTCVKTQKYLTKGYCSKHYSQVRIHGKTFVTYKDKRPAQIHGDIAKIPIGHNAKHGHAIVDLKYAGLDKYSWSLLKGYAVTTIDGKTVFMHSLISATRAGYMTDHKDMNPLNNRLSNLREATFTQNNANRNKYKNNTSGYKGVEFVEGSGKYRARVTFNGRRIHIGCFDKAIEAARAYDGRAKELFGEFARLNYEV